MPCGDARSGGAGVENERGIPRGGHLLQLVAGNRNSAVKTAAPALRNRISRLARRASQPAALPQRRRLRGGPRGDLSHVHPQQGGGRRAGRGPRPPAGPGPGAGVAGGPRGPFAGQPRARGADAVSVHPPVVGVGTEAGRRWGLQQTHRHLLHHQSLKPQSPQ